MTMQEYIIAGSIVGGLTLWCKAVYSTLKRIDNKLGVLANFQARTEVELVDLKRRLDRIEAVTFTSPGDHR